MEKCKVRDMAPLTKLKGQHSNHSNCSKPKFSRSLVSRYYKVVTFLPLIVICGYRNLAPTSARDRACRISTLVSVGTGDFWITPLAMATTICPMPPRSNPLVFIGCCVSPPLPSQRHSFSNPYTVANLHSEEIDSITCPGNEYNSID